MSDREMSGVLGFIHRLKASAELDHQTDRQLLERFAGAGDQCAFAALVQRHATLVYNVCKSALRHDQEAEDAFQAVFLVLARKANSVQWQDSVAGWLHAVASRVTAEARTKQYRRWLREKTSVPLPEPPTTELSMADEHGWHAILHEEIAKLPEKYRAPLLLCHLEGHSREVAAAQLGWTEGAVKGRLERGREALRKRLARRGLTSASVVSALMGVRLEGMTTPAASLVEETLTLCSGWAAGTATTVTASMVLAERVLHVMAGWKKLVWVLLLAVGVSAGSGLAFHYWPRAQVPPPAAHGQAVKDPDEIAPLPKKDKPPRRYQDHKPTNLPDLMHQGHVRGLAFFPQGDRLLTACDDGWTRLWNLGKKDVGQSWNAPGQHTAAAVSRDGKFLAWGTSHGDVAVGQPDGTKVFTTNATHGPIHFLRFSPDSQTLASAAPNGMVVLYEASSGKTLHEFAGHQQRKVLCLDFSPDGALLASVGELGDVTLWNIQEGKKLRTWDGHPTGQAHAVAFHPQGGFLATGGGSGTQNQDDVIRLWNLGDGEISLEIQAPGVRALAFSPAGECLASASSLGALSMWDPRSGRRLHQLPPGPGSLLYTVAFSPDGRLLASSGADQAVKVWQVAD